MQSNLPNPLVWDETVKLGTSEVVHLSQMSWPRFLIEPSDIPDPMLNFKISPEDFAKKFLIWGIRDSVSKKLVAFIHAIQIEIDFSSQNLPDLGWRYAVSNGGKPTPKNSLCLIEASVHPDYRKLGLAKVLLERSKAEARKRGLVKLVAPVRPISKADSPEESIESFLKKTASTGEVLDPWLRTHVASGGQIANICHQSVCIHASLEKWREWTGLPMNHTGTCVIPDALNPIEISLADNIGVYVEPNVWVTYDL
jgi:GNAT superfamily N-acetyltransferase